MYLVIRDDEMSRLSVTSTLGITRSAVCRLVVLAQRRFCAALSVWLDERAAQVSPLHAQPAKDHGQVSEEHNTIAA